MDTRLQGWKFREWNTSGNTTNNVTRSNIVKHEELPDSVYYGIGIFCFLVVVVCIIAFLVNRLCSRPEPVECADRPLTPIAMHTLGDVPLDEINAAVDLLPKSKLYKYTGIKTHKDVETRPLLPRGPLESEPSSPSQGKPEEIDSKDKDTKEDCSNKSGMRTPSSTESPSAEVIVETAALIHKEKSSYSVEEEARNKVGKNLDPRQALQLPPEVIINKLQDDGSQEEKMSSSGAQPQVTNSKIRERRPEATAYDFMKHVRQQVSSFFRKFDEGNKYRSSLEVPDNQALISEQFLDLPLTIEEGINLNAPNTSSCLKERRSPSNSNYSLQVRPQQCKSTSKTGNVTPEDAAVRTEEYRRNHGNEESTAKITNEEKEIVQPTEIEQQCIQSPADQETSKMRGQQKSHEVVPEIAAITGTEELEDKIDSINQKNEEEKNVPVITITAIEEPEETNIQSNSGTEPGRIPPVAVDLLHVPLTERRHLQLLGFRTEEKDTRVKGGQKSLEDISPAYSEPSPSYQEGRTFASALDLFSQSEKQDGDNLVCGLATPEETEESVKTESEAGTTEQVPLDPTTHVEKQPRVTLKCLSEVHQDPKSPPETENVTPSIALELSPSYPQEVSGDNAETKEPEGNDVKGESAMKKETELESRPQEVQASTDMENNKAQEEQEKQNNSNISKEKIATVLASDVEEQIYDQTKFALATEEAQIIVGDEPVNFELADDSEPPSNPVEEESLQEPADAGEDSKM